MLVDALSKFNIDRTRMHLAGYSYGAYQSFALAYKYPKIFASLSLFDGVPGFFNLTNEGESGSDLMSGTTVTTDAQARILWAQAVGDIPLNYQHGALDSNSFTGALPASPTPQQINDFITRVNDPLTSGWFGTFAANGRTVPTTVAATTSPSPAYPTSTKHIYVPYANYDHGGLNSGTPYGFNSPWWNWLTARVRTDYAP